MLIKNHSITPSGGTEVFLDVLTKNWHKLRIRKAGEILLGIK